MKLFAAKKSNWFMRNFNKILLVLLLSIAINLIVYESGGTQYAWQQLNFIVIIIAAYYWQIKGSIIVAFLVGIIMGPFMPLDLYEGIMQTSANWLLRILIYLFVAFITGYAFQMNNKTNTLIKEKELIDPFTGLYNMNKLLFELKKMNVADERFCLVFFNVINIEEISKYVDYSIIDIIIHKGIDHLKSQFKENNLYSSNLHEYILILKDYDEHEIVRKLSKYLEDVLDAIHIKDYSFQLIVKVGIAFRNAENYEATEILNKARIAADQGEIYESGVYTYDHNFNKERKLFNEISGSLNNAIINNEFYLVYQPIINIKDNAVSDAEVLLRWNRGKREPVGPQMFIPIAEQIGLINQITKWILKKVITQKNQWDKVGLKIMTSINITSRELNDENFRKWAKNIIEENNIDKYTLGFEITERVIIKNGEKLRSILLELRAKGYKILIDDFGTGYNSLMAVSEIPFEIIKIDKYFTDRLAELEIIQLVRHIVEFVHEIGGIIIAEGVETKEQFLILKEFGCDMIQGYYFSKPLLPDEFKKYYETFDMNQYL